MNKSANEANWSYAGGGTRLGQLAAWTGAWVLTLAAASFGPGNFWSSSSLTLIAVVVNLLVGIGMIYANVRFMKSQDELMQMIQLEAMGLALGVGVVGGLTYSLLDQTDLIPFDAEIGFVVMLMGVTYMVATAVGFLRYR